MKTIAVYSAVAKHEIRLCPLINLTMVCLPVWWDMLEDVVPSHCINNDMSNKSQCQKTYTFVSRVTIFGDPPFLLSAT